MTVALKSRLGSRGRPAASRDAILQAALAEFSREGVTGARTDAIAKAAKVNKALLYYYFKDKGALYAAVLDQVFGGLICEVMPALSTNLAPREKILAYAAAHFDYIAAHPTYPRVVQGEMMRFGQGGGASQLARVAKQYFRPLFFKLSEVVKAGVMSGEFRKVDPMQLIPSMLAVIIFYFTSAPAMKAVTGLDPLTPERIAARRAAVLDFVSAALFADRVARRPGERS